MANLLVETLDLVAHKIHEGLPLAAHATAAGQRCQGTAAMEEKQLEKLQTDVIAQEEALNIALY